MGKVKKEEVEHLSNQDYILISQLINLISKTVSAKDMMNAGLLFNKVVKICQ